MSAVHSNPDKYSDQVTCTPESGPKTLSKLAAIRAEDPRRLELENLDAICRNGNGQVESKLPEGLRLLIPSVIDESLEPGGAVFGTRSLAMSW